MKRKTPANPGLPLHDEYASLSGFVLQPLARQRGIWGLVRHAHEIGPRETMRAAVYHIRRFVGASFDRLYDRRHHVDTCGHIHARHLDVDVESREFSESYAPTPEKTFRTMLDAIPVDFEKYTFIDYGCGKGRTLLIASEYPFRHIIGIEHSQYLVRIARNNIARYQNDVTGCKNMEVLKMDARDFEPPHSPCLFYLYSPFHGNILRRVLERVEESYRRAPRPMVFAFSEDKNTVELPTSLFEESGCFKLLDESAAPFDLGAPVPLIYATYTNAEALQSSSASRLDAV